MCQWSTCYPLAQCQHTTEAKVSEPVITFPSKAQNRAARGPRGKKMVKEGKDVGYSQLHLRTFQLQLGIGLKSINTVFSQKQNKQALELKI